MEDGIEETKTNEDLLAQDLTTLKAPQGSEVTVTNSHLDVLPEPPLCVTALNSQGI